MPTVYSGRADLIPCSNMTSILFDGVGGLVEFSLKQVD